MKVIIKILTQEDKKLLNQLIEVYKQEFKYRKGRSSRLSFKNPLNNSHIRFFAALYKNEVIGGLTAYILPSVYFAGSEAYLYDIAVKKPSNKKVSAKNWYSTCNCGVP